MAWDDAKRAKAVELYEKGEPTPENSIELVKDIAEELEETPNGVRMILSKAGVYLKKDASAKKETSEKSTTPKVSKADSIAKLKQAISDLGEEPDDDILDKLTGKQAVYLTLIINKALEA